VTIACSNGCGEGLTECGPDGEWSDCTFEENPCVFPHAEAACVDGACVIESCEGSWTNCNHDIADGCEALLGSTEHCSGCGDACARGEECVAGVCRCVPDCDGAACGDSDGCGGTCDGYCPAGEECRDGRCRCVPDCGGAACGDSDGCGGTCDGPCPTDEHCTSSGCECDGSLRRGSTGRCVRSCGGLLGSLGYYDDGGGCCASGCAAGIRQAGGPGDTWDCIYCCEGNPSGGSCN
jgi:hypothetical protein